MFYIKIIGGVVRQFYNTDQVVEVMFQFIEKTLQVNKQVHDTAVIDILHLHHS